MMKTQAGYEELQKGFSNWMNREKKWQIRLCIRDAADFTMNTFSKQTYNIWQLQSLH